MILVVFELEPRDGQSEAYFDLAADIGAELEHVDGFVSVERFQSLACEGKYLSLSVWRDEAAVKAWRTHSGHRAAQALGRSRILANYTLRVAQVLRNYGQEQRDEVPADSAACHGG